MKNNEKGFGVIEILLVVAAIGLLGGVVWTFFNNQKSATNSTSLQHKTTETKNEQQAKTPTLQPEDVIGKIKSDWASKYTLINTEDNNHPKTGELSIWLHNESPNYKVGGYDFYTNYDGGSTIAVMPYDPNPTSYTVPKTADMALRADIASAYQDLGLSKAKSIGEKGSSMETDVYVGKGLVCTVETSTAATSNNTASCGIVESYNAAAEQTRPFAEVIPGVDSSTILANLKISDSPVSSYQKASLTMGSVNGGGSVALLYKKGSGSWTYFRNTQEQVQCSAYNTVDLRNAFKGEPCYGADGQEVTVQ